MFATRVNRIKQLIDTSMQALRKQLAAWTKPMTSSLVVGSMRDFMRTKPQLIAENALLRQQMIVLNESFAE